MRRHDMRPVFLSLVLGLAALGVVGTPGRADAQDYRRGYGSYHHGSPSWAERASWNGPRRWEAETMRRFGQQVGGRERAHPVQYFDYGPLRFNVNRALVLAANGTKYRPELRRPSPDWIGPFIDINW